MADDSPRLYGDALAYATRRRVRLPSDYYGDRRLQARAWSFTVSGLASIDQIQAVLDQVNDVVASGGTFEAWKRDVRTGKASLTLPDHRLSAIVRTNVQQSYAAGRWTQMARNTGRRPYLMYDAINDSRVRPAHAAMDNFIARHDDPIWKRWHPPAGINCRCIVRALTAEQAQARGINVQGAAPNVEPDPGWDYDRRQGWAEAMGRVLTDRQGQCRVATFARRKQPQVWCQNDIARAHIETLRRFAAAGGQMPEAKGQGSLPVLNAETLRPEAIYGVFERAADGFESARWLRDLGISLIVDDALFKDHRGQWKIKKNERARYVNFLADTIHDPAEVGLIERPNDGPQLWLFGSYATQRPLLTKVVFELVGKGKAWTGVSAYQYRDAETMDADRAETRLIYRRP